MKIVVTVSSFYRTRGVLSTDHAASSYGQPVLLFDDGIPRGPHGEYADRWFTPHPPYAQFDPAWNVSERRIVAAWNRAVREIWGRSRAMGPTLKGEERC